MKYAWKEIRHPRKGTVEYKLQCPLMRGEHRPPVFVTSPQAAVDNTDGIMRWGKAFATAISGYTQQFHSVEEAQEYAGDVPSYAVYKGHKWYRE